MTAGIAAPETSMNVVPLLFRSTGSIVPRRLRIAAKTSSVTTPTTIVDRIRSTHHSVSIVWVASLWGSSVDCSLPQPASTAAPASSPTQRTPAEVPAGEVQKPRPRGDRGDRLDLGDA